MLILSRQIGEGIVIGEGDDRITVTVVRIGPDVVRLGIEAPRNVSVHRDEIQARIEEERQQHDD